MPPRSKPASPEPAARITTANNEKAITTSSRTEPSWHEARRGAACLRRNDFPLRVPGLVFPCIHLTPRRCDQGYDTAAPRQPSAQGATCLRNATTLNQHSLAYAMESPGPKADGLGTRCSQCGPHVRSRCPKTPLTWTLCAVGGPILRPGVPSSGVPGDGLYPYATEEAQRGMRRGAGGRSLNSQRMRSCAPAPFCGDFMTRASGLSRSATLERPLFLAVSGGVDATTPVPSERGHRWRPEGPMPLLSERAEQSCCQIEGAQVAWPICRSLLGLAIPGPLKGNNSRRAVGSCCASPSQKSIVAVGRKSSRGCRGCRQSHSEVGN